MGLNLNLLDPDGAVAREAHRDRLRAAALERLAREGRTPFGERTARRLVAFAARLAPSLRITVAEGARRAPSFGD